MGLVGLVAEVKPVYLVTGAMAITALIFYIKQFALHPLARYPGPLIGRCTSLYAAYHAWRGTLHTDMYRCHQRYGPVVRYAPSRLLFNTNTAAKDIYAHGANNTKSAVYQELVHGAPNILTLRHKEEHAWRRRILSLGLSDSKVASYEQILQHHIRSLCSIIQDSITTSKKGSRTALDMACQSDYFTFDIMAEVIFGMKYNALKDPTYRFVATALQQSNVRISAIVQAAVLKVGRLDKHLFPESIKGRNQFLGFITSLLKNKSSMSVAGQSTVFSFLEGARDPEGGERSLSAQQVRAECATLVVAGSDTSSSTLAAILFYLSDNLQAYRRAAKEVRDVFRWPDDICLGPQLNSCVYLRACIDEALRLSPPVGGALWREVGPGGMTVDLIHVPAGTDVGTGIYSLHHNADYFEEPFTFKPERWLAGETNCPVERARTAFVPFSTGPRSCVGKGFAYHELGLTLANILHRYRFTQAPSGDSGEERRSLGPGGKDEFLLRDHITGAKTGPLLVFQQV